MRHRQTESTTECSYLKVIDTGINCPHSKTHVQRHSAGATVMGNVWYVPLENSYYSSAQLKHVLQGNDPR